MSHTQLADLEHAGIKAWAAGFLAALICIVKYPHRIFHGFMWAEDGVVFVAQAAELGVRAVWTPYAGYLHAVPRLIVGAWVLLAEPERFPHGFAWSSIAVYVVIGASLFGLSRRHFPRGPSGDAGALAVAVLPFIVPQSPEVYVTLTNLQWLFAPVLAFLLVDLCTGHDTLGRRAGSFILGLTGPFGVVMLPPAIAILVAGKRGRWKALLPYFAACVLQLGAFVLFSAHMPGPTFAGYPWIADYARGALYEVFYPHILQSNLPAPLVGIALIVALVAVAIFNGRRPTLVAAPLFAVAAGLWCLGVVRQATPGTLMHWSGYGARYVLLPVVAMMIALLFAIYRGRYTAGRLCAALLLIGMLLKPFPHASVTGDATVISREGTAIRMNFPPNRTIVLDEK
jgi:hypothetical protein